MTLTAPPPQPPAPPQHTSKRADSRWKTSKPSLLIAIVCMVGIVVLLYPSAAGWFSAIQQAEELGNYTHDVELIGPAGREEALAAAHAYNDTLTGGTMVAANARLPQAENASPSSEADYHQLLAADAYGLMARIKIPAIDADLPIFHGTSDSVLQQGIGHLEGSSLPVGGVGTHSVLTGHRGLATSTLFTHLDLMEVGDTFTIETFGEVLSYRVATIKVVQPDETESLYPQAGKDLVTLITCTPLGINSERILVTGERVLPTPHADAVSAAQPPAAPFPWWAVQLGGGVVVVGAYIWFSARAPRERGEPASSQPG